MESEKPNFLQVVISVLAAFLGVQSSKNHERDFQHGKPIHYIAVGLLLTVLFVLTIWGVVRLVLSAAGV
jgi:hypothetical protein